MFARGAGQAVAQLDVNYGVDFEPFKVNERAHCLLKSRYHEKATKFEKRSHPFLKICTYFT